MSNFSYPFPFDYLKIDGEKLRTVLQQCIADEYEAASRYRAIALLADDENIKKILNDIANEEIVHVGEFQTILYRFFPEDVDLVHDGQDEADEKMDSGKEQDIDEEIEDDNETEIKDKIEEESEDSETTDGKEELNDEEGVVVDQKETNKKIIKLIKVRK